MKSAGLDALYDIENLAFLGFVEVIKHIPFIKKVQKEIIRKVETENTKTAVLIDYPGFNLSLAKKLKKLGLKIIYYISPQIWAWGKGRIKKIRRLVDHMIVVFPFEKEMYESAGVRVSFVGHPLIGRINEYNFMPENEFRKKHEILKEILLVMPGSRKHEVEKIFPETIKAAEIIAERNYLQTVVACSENIDESIFSKYSGSKNYKVVKGQTYELLKYSRFGIIKSGTSTLEAGLFQLPYIVVYSTSCLTYEIMKFLIKIKNIAIVNIILKSNVIPELIQDDVNKEKIIEESEKFLKDENKYRQLKGELIKLAEVLGDTNASAGAAEIITKEMKNAEAA